MSDIGLPPGFLKKNKAEDFQPTATTSPPPSRDHKELALRCAIEHANNVMRLYAHHDDPAQQVIAITPPEVVNAAQAFYEFLSDNRLNRAKQVAEQLKFGET